jgi:purine-nucleoside phosphorylase
MTTDHSGAAKAMPGPGDASAEAGVALIRERCDVEPVFAIVLGSGLGDAVGEDLVACHDFSFRALPGFPPSTVPGHAGRLAIGRLYGVPVAVFFGRIHFYEGHGIGATTLIPRLAAALGARTLVLTNASGGLDPALRAGHLMVLTDHLNMLGVNPLSGWRTPSGSPAFVDLSHVYDDALRREVLDVASEKGIDVKAGVYVALPGPSYETPAETAFLRTAGAHAVGMSTVPEAVAAAALGLSVVAISCVTNAAGYEVTHQEILETGKKASADLRSILRDVLAARAEGDGATGDR